MPEVSEVMPLSEAQERFAGKWLALEVVSRDRNGMPREVRLIDLSTASTPWTRRLGLAGRGAGTVGYIAPEVVAGRRAGKGADIYALGATAYELLTGRAPFSGASRHDTLGQLARGGFTPPSRLRGELPKSVDDILARMLAHEPEQRPLDAALAAQQLSAALASAPLGGGEG